MWCGRWERPRNDTGASSLEYAGLVLVAALIIAGLVTATTNTVSPATKAALCSLFQDGCTTSAGTGSPTTGGASTTSPSGSTENSGEAPQSPGEGSQTSGGGSIGPTGGGNAGAGDPDTWSPAWNKKYANAGADPFGPAWRALTDQANDFLEGINKFFKDGAQGLFGAIWDDLTGIAELVTNPVQSAEGLWWTITNPDESLPLLIWDEESQDEWDNGSKTKAVARTAWNIGSWFIPGYNVGKAISKIGKLGKAAKAAKAADLANGAKKAADRARELAKKGDLPGARKAADEARRKADEARKRAQGAGCKVVSLGPPGPGTYTFYGRFGGFVPTAGLPSAAQGCKDADGNGTDDTVDKAERQANAAKTAFQTALEKIHGIPKENQEKFQRLANSTGWTIEVRPTNPTSVPWLRKGALPKPEAIKAKTISNLDVKLGAKEGTQGLVGFFDPKLPPRGDMTDADWEALTERFEERKNEYNKLKSKMDKFERGNEFKVVDGVVYGHSNGQWKHITGDHDLFDIRKSDGKRLTSKEERSAIARMREMGLPIEHGPHMYWNPDPADEFNNNIRNGIIKKHGPGKEPLVRFAPNEELPRLVDSEGNPVP